ncbi:hypothetical protein CRG98_011373 [Punica granatum]|uniref:Uncharacterized protein n=1 Tax=Punica granatum TaxID=22663 RepID=A0A2I0KI94_PUNGR|nr:hypothetical protein CRG98_011373 [Punica granatum]
MPFFTGARQPQARNDAWVHAFFRTPIGSFLLYFDGKGPDEEVFPMKPKVEAIKKPQAIKHNHLSRHRALPPSLSTSIGFETTLLQEAPARKSQNTVGDDDRIRRPPWATSTIKTGAFAFDVRTKITSDIIHPR